MEQYWKLWFKYVIFLHQLEFQSYKYKYFNSTQAESHLTIKSIKNLISECVSDCPESVKICVYQVWYKYLNAASSCDAYGFQPNEAYNMNTHTLMDEDLFNTTKFRSFHKLSDMKENLTFIITVCTFALTKPPRKPLTQAQARKQVRQVSDIHVGCNPSSHLLDSLGKNCSMGLPEPCTFRHSEAFASTILTHWGRGGIIWGVSFEFFESFLSIYSHNTHWENFEFFLKLLTTLIKPYSQGNFRN